MGLSILVNGTQEEKLEWTFHLYDLDGDGVISMYELEYFYEEQLQRMEQLGIETLPFDDCLCQVQLKTDA